MAKFQRRRGRDVPKSKRLANRPYATKGHKVGAFSGGVITRKPLLDGRVLVTLTDEEGRRTQHIEEATNVHH